MELVTTTKDLESNLYTLENYLNSSIEEEREFAKGLILRGICFVAFKVAGNFKFAPSRFVGYKSNHFLNHCSNNNKSGKETNLAISNLLDGEPIPDENLENEYILFCKSIRIYPKQNGRQRKFWMLDLR